MTACGDCSLCTIPNETPQLIDNPLQNAVQEHNKNLASINLNLTLGYPSTMNIQGSALNPQIPKPNPRIS
jgi:hypothetical protein